MRFHSSTSGRMGSDASATKASQWVVPIKIPPSFGFHFVFKYALCNLPISSKLFVFERLCVGS